MSDITCLSASTGCRRQCACNGTTLVWTWAQSTQSHRVITTPQSSTLYIQCFHYVRRCSKMLHWCLIAATMQSTPCTGWHRQLLLQSDRFMFRTNRYNCHYYSLANVLAIIQTIASTTSAFQSHNQYGNDIMWQYGVVSTWQYGMGSCLYVCVGGGMLTEWLVARLAS